MSDALCGCPYFALPAGIKEIGYQAFYESTSLGKITLPAGLTSIGRSAFEGCTSLTLASPFPASCQRTGHARTRQGSRPRAA